MERVTMTKAYITKNEVLTEAKKILGRSLRSVMSDDGVDISEIEQRLLKYGSRRKGLLGELVEEFVFGLDVNNRAEADFNIAGVELKTKPAQRTCCKKHTFQKNVWCFQ
jgi:DNA mismatch repair protein MutH